MGHAHLHRIFQHSERPELRRSPKTVLSAPVSTQRRSFHISFVESGHSFGRHSTSASRADAGSKATSSVIAATAPRVGMRAVSVPGLSCPPRRITISTRASPPGVGLVQLIAPEEPAFHDIDEDKIGDGHERQRAHEGGGQRNEAEPGRQRRIRKRHSYGESQERSLRQAPDAADPAKDELCG